MVSFVLSEDRLIVETKGKGALDKLQIIRLPLSAIKNFCLVPVTGVQQLQTFRSAGDQSYNSEFIFSYHEGRKVKTKRVFVNSSDAAFDRLLTELKRKCPEASLLHLQPATALNQVGVVAATKAMRVILALLIGIPVLIALVFIISKIVHG